MTQNSPREPGDELNKRPGNDNAPERPFTDDVCDCPTCRSDCAGIVPCRREEAHGLR